MRNEHGPLGKAWIDIGSDINWINYGGRWARHVEGTRYHVIRFENTDEWGDADIPKEPYHCDLQEVDLSNTEQLEASRESCGYAEDWCDDYGKPLPELAKVEAMSGHGAYAPLWQEAGTNAWKLLRAARAESRLLATNNAEYEARMDRPVNKIGSTAREYAAGDTSSAILRGLAERDPTAELMAKLGMLQVVHIGDKR